jgi:hypothetical protein
MQVTNTRIDVPGIKVLNTVGKDARNKFTEWSRAINSDRIYNSQDFQKMMKQARIELLTENINAEIICISNAVIYNDPCRMQLFEFTAPGIDTIWHAIIIYW